jgi:hypothetical protein
MVQLPTKLHTDCAVGTLKGSLDEESGTLKGSLCEKSVKHPGEPRLQFKINNAAKKLEKLVVPLKMSCL